MQLLNNLECVVSDVRYGLFIHCMNIWHKICVSKKRELMRHILNMKMSYPIVSLIFAAEWDTSLSNNVIVHTPVFVLYEFSYLSPQHCSCQLLWKVHCLSRKSSICTLSVRLCCSKSMACVCLSFMVQEQNIRSAI